ncbi:collectin-12-like [Apostichopus japonicus]|uniref:collectin-12-like n=1 Tax=Stichopus japonicus TaxID=307972 RepID=UPI003AB91557
MAFVILFFAVVSLLGKATSEVNNFHCTVPRDALPNFHVPSGSPTTVGIRSNFDIGVETTRIVTGTMTTEDKLLNNNDGNTTTLTTSPTDFNTSTGSLRTTATMGIINTTTTNDVIPNGTPYSNSGCGVWIKRGSSLYYFITIKMQRTIAAMQCNSMAAHLAYIENAQEAALIAELVGNCSTAHNLFVWMGLTDVETEGTWKWGPSLAYFFNWGSIIESEPNGGNQQNCGAIGVYSGKWYDTDCTNEYQAICEREI